MSWMKRQGGAAPRPDAQAYAAPQPYGNQQNMFPSYQGPLPSQQQSWQMSQQQQQQYNQQYGQVYQQQQPYVNNTNQYYQQPHQQYNQNYVNQNFDQQSYQQNYTHNQPPQQQNFNQNEGHGDAWEDNWGWGWEDSSKYYQNSINQTVPPQPAVQPQAFNNVNVIEESFASTNTWNWSMEDKKEPEVPSSMQPLKNNQDEPLHNENLINENNIVPAPPVQGNASNMLVKEKTEEVKSLSDKDVVKEQLPNLALGKRINLENLTPQWSIESQMSQDSSDGPHTQSEGTYRSENQSRNSSKSSPGPNTDATNFNFSHSRLNDMSLTNSEWSKHSNEDSIPISGAQNVNRSESYDELVTSVQEMNIANHENVPLDIQQPSHNIEQVQDKIEPFKAPEPSVSLVSVSQNQIMSQSMPPPPPVSSQHVLNPLQAVNSSLTNTTPLQPLPPINVPSSSQLVTTSLPPPSSVPLLPPTSFQASSNQNPFKSGAPFSHKNIAKAPTSGQPQPFVPHMLNTGLTSPSAVNKVVHQDRLSASFGANLETTPDNSERPDQPQVLSYRSMPAQPQVPDNLEIAPQNDRNEYLQTAHLSSGDYSENTDFSRNIPPPGIRRMGVGQQEVEYNQTLNISGDEPPPGLARMVPGQQTETDNSYNQVVGDDYMDRQIDGQPTDGSGRPYRQAEGQQVADNYAPPTTTRGGDRRPVGLDRMVPGEPSNDEYPQYQSSNFTPANEHRVVTGVDHDYPIPPDSSRSDIREQNVDGSDYTEPPPRNPSRSVIGAREASNVTSPDYSASIDDQQREITMEGENLQDLSVITYDGLTASAADAAKERSHDAADVAEYPPNNSRRQSLNRVTSGEDSERDKAYKASPRKDRDKQKSRDRDRDRERDKDRGRYSRGDRKYDRDPERRRDRGDRERDRRDKEGSPDARRYRRSTRSHRYETEDTDYYSDKERDRRQYREGSYTSSKPPRGDDKDRRYDDRERRRYNTIERERRNDEERGRRGDRRDRHRDRDRFEARYRDIDPRKLTSLRRDRDDDDRRKGENYSSGSRAGSREATATDEDGEEPRRRTHRDERRRHRHHHYYEGYGMAVPSLEASVAPGGAGAWDEALEAQRRQYEYYERLRRSDPAAYMRVYKQLLHPGLYGASLYDGYGGLGYDGRVEERGSVHSGRSSANGLKAADTELTTDMSLNLHLEESTVRSERMTPFKYSTAHVKGVLCARALIVVPAAYPADGRAAPLRLLQLQALAPPADLAALQAYPGPLVKGVTHKKSVVEYCESRVRAAGAEGGADVCGWALLWELLALLLRQNGVVVGSDIAELLMKNTKEFEYKPPSLKSSEYRGGSVGSNKDDEEEEAMPIEIARIEEEVKKPAVDEKEALDRFREYLIFGNKQEALEWAMQCGLWGHALQLSAGGDRRVRAAVCARFVAALPATDPLHSLYAVLAQRAPPAATCVSDALWGDWRPHAAIMLSNPSAKPEQDRRNLTQLGDTLNTRGLLYSAQFCYLSAGVPFSVHPLSPHRVQRAPGALTATPPRLSLLLSDPRVTSLQRFATNHAIFATEIYEYALSLSQDYVLHELTVYKLVAGTRLADAGQCERALAYAEAAARALSRAPALYRASLAVAIAGFADRLKYYDPSLQEDVAEGVEGNEGGEDSPRHQQWLQDLHTVALQLSAEASQQNTPHHQADSYSAGSWAEQTLQHAQQVQQCPDPAEDTTDYSQYYQHQQQQVPQQQQYQQHQEQQQQFQQQQQLQTVPEAGGEPPLEQYGYEEHARSYADPYWQGDTLYGYQDHNSGAEEVPAPTITMPGAPPSRPSRPAMFGDVDERPPSASAGGADQNDRDTDTSKMNGKKGDGKNSDNKDKRSGWLGGILTKLSLRAPNQMILPDDTNPTIVWDEQHQRWRDTDAADSAVSGPPPPPPSGPAPAPGGLPPALSTSTPLQSPGAPPVSNIFKMQKGRHIKKSYVDVLNPGGARLDAAAPPAPLAPLAPMAPPDNYFIPAPLPDQGGIYDPSQVTAAGEEFRSGI